MKSVFYIAGAAVALPLLLTLLFKLLNAVQSVLSKVAVCLLWLVSAAGSVFSALYFWEKHREERRYSKATSV